MKSAREEILDRLHAAVHSEPEMPDFIAPVYHAIEEPLEKAFKQNLEQVNGNVHLFETEEEAYRNIEILINNYPKENICCNEDDIANKLKENKIRFVNYNELPEFLEVGITGCEFLIAHTGSVMVSSAQQGGRQLFIYPSIHIVVAQKHQMVDYLESAYDKMMKKYDNNLPSQITLITGPSRTADIEKTLILGAHGPKKLHVFLY